MSMMTTELSNFIVDLDDPRAMDSGAVGTKAANLARLLCNGFNVPGGFVVTATACDRIREALSMPDAVWADILANLDQFAGQPVAVRSSGLAEDLPDASYAGQYESVLEVVGVDAIAEAIRRCVTSSTRVHAYTGSTGNARMAVIVQQMVPADAAGIAFTANPVTGDHETLVSAVKGLGDRLAGGEATPDEWVVRGDVVTCLRSPEGALNHDAARDVASLAESAERLFDSPQDIEWAMVGGQTYLLQARPITALPVAPNLEPPAEGFWLKDDAHFPTPLTPFGASIYLPALTAAAPPMAEYGLMIDAIEQRSLAGEVYMRIVPFGGKDRPAPPPWLVKLGLRIAPPLRRRVRAAESALDSGLAEQVLDRWEVEWRPSFVAEFQALHSVDLETLSIDGLLDHLDRATDMLRRGADLHFRLVAPYNLGLYDLGVVCKDLLGWELPQAIELLAGTSVASSDPGRALRALASRVADDPVARDALIGPHEDRWAAVSSAAPWVAAALNEYLAQFGHRTVNYDPGEPTWFERPERVLALVAALVPDGAVDRASDSGRTDALDRARSGLAARTVDERDRFERTLAFARRAYAQREDNVIWLDSQPSALLRYCAVEMGARLVRQGSLDKATDAVFLEVSELRAAITNSGTADLRQLTRRRKGERAWVMAHPGPAFHGTPPPPPPPLTLLPPAMQVVHTALLQSVAMMMAPSTPQDDPCEVRGVPGSPGRYTGTARVVRDETEFSKLNSGDVLVAPVTSPPWSVLFLQAGAVVTDGGGVLSHTAVIAREYGIPAVLATGEATRLLRDGDTVTVDGTTGRVTVVPGRTGPR